DHASPSIACPTPLRTRTVGLLSARPVSWGVLRLESGRGPSGHAGRPPCPAGAHCPASQGRRRRGRGPFRRLPEPPSSSSAPAGPLLGPPPRSCSRHKLLEAIPLAQKPDAVVYT